MTEEKFQIIKELQEKIESNRRKILNIDRLLTGCSLGCKITGRSSHRFAYDVEHFISDKDGIIDILKLDRERIESRLNELEKLFSEQ